MPGGKSALLLVKSVIAEKSIVQIRSRPEHFFYLIEDDNGQKQRMRGMVSSLPGVAMSFLIKAGFPPTTLPYGSGCLVGAWR